MNLNAARRFGHASFGIVVMGQAALEPKTYGFGVAARPKLGGETRRRLGKALRAVYAETVDLQPIPDNQIELLLQLRRRERELKRG